jgi:hypothetical protein
VRLNAQDVLKVLVDHTAVAHRNNSRTWVSINHSLAGRNHSLAKQVGVIMAFFPLAAHHAQPARVVGTAQLFNRHVFV